MNRFVYRNAPLLAGLALALLLVLWGLQFDPNLRPDSAYRAVLFAFAAWLPIPSVYLNQFAPEGGSKKRPRRRPLGVE